MTIQYLENAVTSNRWSLIRSLKIFSSEKKMNCGGMDSDLNEKRKKCELAWTGGCLGGMVVQ